MTYNAEANAKGCWELAIAEMRKELLQERARKSGEQPKPQPVQAGLDI